MTDQLHAIERARLAVEHLAQRDPDKLRTHMPLNNWLSLDEGDRRRTRAATRDMRSSSDVERPR